MVGDGEPGRAHDLGARLVREEADGLGAAAQLLAVAQRLPAALAAVLLEAYVVAAPAPDMAAPPRGCAGD